MNDEDDLDLHDRMREAAETLVVDPARVRDRAVRGGRRRRRVRTGLAVGGTVASVALVAGLAASGVGQRVVGGDDVAGDPVADPGPAPVRVQAVIGNVTVTRGADGRFTAKGGLAPRATATTRVELWAGRRGRELVERETYAPRAGLGVFGRRYVLAPGVWNIELRYVDTAGILATGVYATTIVLR